VLAPHEKHTNVAGPKGDGVKFNGTAHSCRWAYLLRTPRLLLRAGHYVLDLQVEVESGSVFGGVLDVEKDQFVAQAEVQSGRATIKFPLMQDSVIDVVLRQGTDASVTAVYQYGRISTSTEVQELTASVEAQKDSQKELRREAEATAGQSEQAVASELPSHASPLGSVKSTRIYCPMVYTTLSVFHHSLDVSICCYMEKAPGERQPNLKDGSLLRVYNDPGFALVRRTLKTDRHIPVCDSCPYGASRS
jgi:hypothetical protein